MLVRCMSFFIMVVRCMSFFVITLHHVIRDS